MTAIEAMLDYYDIPYRGGVGEQAIRCPVHDDSHASASFNGSKELFNCHACGARGSVYDMVMQKEGVDFASAKQIVEKRTGISHVAVPGGPVVRTPVPPGSGYRPRQRGKVPARGRQRLQF